MMENKYYYGNKISEYGLEHGYVDYATFSKSFDAVLNNDIMSQLERKGFYFEMIHGFIDNSDEIEELEEKIEELEENEEENEEEIEELQDEIDRLRDCEGYPETDIYQYYIVGDNGADILQRETNEIIFYCEELDMYIWGVCHWGTSWDYVLTNIKIDW